LQPPFGDGSVDHLHPPLPKIGRERVEPRRHQDHGRRRDESPPGEVPLDRAGARAREDEQQRSNRPHRYGEPPRALTAAVDHALESLCLIARETATSVLVQRLDGKQFGAIGHGPIVGYTGASNKLAAAVTPRGYDQAVEIWTIGHSTLPIESFLDALTTNAIALLVDVRRFPGSRRHPQFSRDALAPSLASSNIDYAHYEALGGRRRPRADSHNTAWRNESFRGYADYMETPEFSRAIDALLRQAAAGRVAIMCAEMLWWQCHRGLIADYLKAGGHEVTHIGSGGKTASHPFTSAAQIIDGRLSYGGLFGSMSS
jgi:hypothetical protein